MCLVKKETWELMQPGFCYLLCHRTLSLWLQNLPPLGHHFPGCNTRIIILTHLTGWGKAWFPGQTLGCYENIRVFWGHAYMYTYIYLCVHMYVCVYLTLKSVHRTLRACQGLWPAGCKVIRYLFSAFFFTGASESTRPCDFIHPAMLQSLKHPEQE